MACYMKTPRVWSRFKSSHLRMHVVKHQNKITMFLILSHPAMSTKITSPIVPALFEYIIRSSHTRKP